ncbi:hypothetical protein LTR56_010878 [Elasticomyces elasticus]|nr:hypothetical protein LTR56_010878 [Elasticomyces elasticus]KAK3650249.1 hypothetical protein LTR22_012576 [Elasticomyces elasticus]KAK4911840.1 hypothetical protein LTR49_019640 [Elasticomyces elasticus]KAK5768268.1 hypothetical protein LTS12_001407 [Elasticomyces elasticus]
MPAATPAVVTPTGIINHTSQNNQRRASGTKFANLQEYKREAHPEAVKERQKWLEEMKPEPKGVLGGLWDR